jgi:hypothetical protein
MATDTLSASGNNTYSSAPLDTISNANINTAAGSDDTYTLDTLGNWSSSATGTGTSTAPTLTSTSRTNNSQNELTNVGGTGFGFDNDGNLLQNVGGEATGTVQYDAWNRLVDGPDEYALSYLPNEDVAIRARTAGTSGATVSIYSTDMQVLQDDHVGTGDASCVTSTSPPQSQYVWGLAYVNQMVERDDDSHRRSVPVHLFEAESPGRRGVLRDPLAAPARRLVLP